MWTIKENSEFKVRYRSGSTIEHVIATCGDCGREYPKVCKANIVSGKSSKCIKCAAIKREKISPVGRTVSHYKVVKELDKRVGKRQRLFLLHCYDCNTDVECVIQSIDSYSEHECLCANKHKKLANSQKLLEETLESYYWLGFIMADGHISKNNRLSVSLSIKDKEHLSKLANFMEFKGELDETDSKISLKLMDNSYLPFLVDRFSISSRKTYEPCNITKIEKDDFFTSWLVGFIDGDGCIRKVHNRKDSTIVIKLHSSWLDNLNYIGNRIYRIFNIDNNPPKAKINNSGYARINFCNHKIVHALGRFVESSGLKDIVLARKWDLIDFSAGLRYDRTKETRKKVKEMLLKGIKQVEIAKELNISEATVSTMKKEICGQQEEF